jgi:hypothetical protein
MKQLPDILTSTTFWASIATLWAASGAWFTYVAAELASRQRTYEGIMSLIEGLEEELELVSQWAGGADGNQGYLKKSPAQLSQEHTDWFNPSRAIFKFTTPTLSNLTSSAYASYLTPIIKPLVMLNHSIRRLFDNIDRYHMFVFGDVEKYQSTLPKFALNPPNWGLSPMPTTVAVPHPSQVGLTQDEQVYVNHIFMMNAQIHQNIIGGADSTDENCLYRSFRTARAALKKFKEELKREKLPRKFWVLHLVAGAMALMGVWQVLRWFEVLR